MFFDEKKSKAIFENLKEGEKISFIIGIDRNTKPRETTGMPIKLKTVSGEVDRCNGISGIVYEIYTLLEKLKNPANTNSQGFLFLLIYF